MLPVVVNGCPVADLSYTPRPLGFPPRLSAKTLLTYRCRSSSTDHEIVGVRNRFLFRDRIHPLCRVDRYLTAPIGGSVFVLSTEISRVSRDASVLPTLSILVPPAILLQVPPTFALKTVSSKVLGFGIVLTFPFTFLVFVFVLFVFVAFTFLALALAFTFLVAPLPFVCLVLLYPASRSTSTASPAAVSACARQ